jgi:4-amino-4-deoxy-L-arabinose transferase-like glycosyltransferase
MMEFLKKRWVLLLVLVVFIICKIPHLFYAYYWDESWPYAVAIKQMYLHGISLSPTAIDGELSRGHPLFFHAAGAAWMKVFGPSHVSMHSFALLITVLFLITIYEAGIRLFSQRAAIFSLVLVATQELFFVQSSFVLFEMLVAFLCFAGIFFYVKDKFFLTALCLTALFYTKESGLIAGFVVGMAALIGLFNKRVEWKVRMYRVASVGVPVILIGIFFLWQKHVRGWYILPLYNNLIEHDWSHFWYNFRVNCLRNSFHQNQRYYYFFILLAISVIAAFKNRSVKYLVLFLPAAIIYVCVDNDRVAHVLSSISLFVYFILSIALILFAFRKLKIYSDDKQEKFIVLLCVFSFCFFCFSASNFFTYRYLLPTIVASLFFLGVMLDKFIDRTYRLAFYPVLALILVISSYAFHESVDYGDAEVGAFDALDVQQHVIDHFESSNYYDRSIGCGGFLNTEHLTDPASGFLHSEKSFKRVRWYIDRETEFAIFDNIEPDGRYEQTKNDSAFKLEYRYEKGRVWAEVYVRK